VFWGRRPHVVATGPRDPGADAWDCTKDVSVNSGVAYYSSTSAFRFLIELATWMASSNVNAVPRHFGCQTNAHFGHTSYVLSSSSFLCDQELVQSIRYAIYFSPQIGQISSTPPKLVMLRLYMYGYIYSFW
jgi:hypothetical protein